MLRALIKTEVAGALHLTRADKLIGVLSGFQRMPPVICYHRVVEHFPAHAASFIPSMLISSQMLERHLDWIGCRFRFVSLDELGTRLEWGEPFGKPVAAITFDDGYAGVYHHAFPLLKRKGMPSAVFVVTDLIGTSRLQVYDKLHLLLTRAFSVWRSAPHSLARLLLELGIRLPEMERMSKAGSTPVLAMRVLLNGLPLAELHRVIKALEVEFEIEESAFTEFHPLSWEMLSEMQHAGVIIGSHTKTHALLTNESRQKVLDEAAGSRQVLERKLGIPIKHFAYPNGWFNATTVKAAAGSGYRFGYTTCRHRDPSYPLLTTPRIPLWQNSGLDAFGRFSSAVMGCQLNGVFDLMARCRQDHEG